MATTNLKKVLTVVQGLVNRDSDLAATYLHPQKYTEHNPQVADGIDGFRAHIQQLSHPDHLDVVRTFEDGPYVVIQEDGYLAGQGTFFEVFRFEDGLIVEHWLFSAPAAPPNQSGHTQTDGPVEARHLQDTERNKAFLGDYYQRFHIGGDHSGYERYFQGDICIRHEPGVRDGVAQFMTDVKGLMQHRSIDEVKLLLGQGDFVFIAATGTHEGAPCLYIDLYRVEEEKIVEHWGFPQAVPPPAQWQNTNGPL